MNEIEPIVFDIDDRPVQEAVKRSNKAIDDFRSRTVSTTGYIGNAWERMARDLERVSRPIESIGGSMERMAKGLASAARGGIEFAGAMALGAKAIAAQTTATGALEAGWNRVRAARIGAAAVTEGLGGAIVVGTEIAAVVAIEKIAKSTYDRSKEIQSQALAAQRTDFSYSDRVALDFTAQRAGLPADAYDSAVKSAGGVAQLAKELRDLAAIGDPLTRAEVAFREFGPDADRVLASLGDRFGDNAERAKSWGLVLDEVSRTRIDGFRRDVDAIRGSFDSLEDSIAGTKRQLGSLLELDFASLWQLGKAVATDEGGRNSFRQLFTEPDPKDVLKGAQRDIQARSSSNATALAQQEMLRSLTAPAEKAFQKDFFAKDQEADLRAEIEQLRKKLFVQDRTSADFGHLVSGASFPGGYGSQAESLQKLTSDQGQLSRVVEAKKAQKDADEAAKKAAQELASAERAVAAGLESAQRAELSGADRLRFERDGAIAQYGKTRDLVRDINKEFNIRFGIEGKALIDQSAADMRTRAAAEARQQEAGLNARTGYASRAILDTIRISGEAPAKRDDLDRQGADVQRESQLQALESFPAKTLAQKASVEAAKFQIESSYFTRIQDLEAAGINRRYDQETAALRVLLSSRLISEDAYSDQKTALNKNQELEQLKLAQSTQAEIEKAGIAAAKAVREEYQRQFDTIKSEASGLLSTLFANPSAFGKQFAETIRAAVLRPIIDSLSDSIAGALHPLVYGGTQGGIAGKMKRLFGSKPLDPAVASSNLLKGATDVNTGATDRNTDALLRMADSWERGSGGSGSDMEGLSGRGGFEGIAGGVEYRSSPIGSSLFSDNPAAMLGPGATAPFAAAGGWGGFSSSGGTSTAGGFLSAIPRLFGASTSGGGLFRSISEVQTGGGLLGGFRNIASNFKNTDWGGFNRQAQGIPGVDGQPGIDTGDNGDGTYSQGKITGMHGMAGSLVMAGGMSLAQHGLLGQDRGTGKGIFEGAAGGAMVGFEMGGPIGAAVGAAVGAGIGLGEMIAGVESDENKAKRLVKDLYRIDISIQMARQIVQIANSKYGHNVNFAIRSPEVRQMLELYSAGTGQAGKMPLSSTTPTGASLSEMGGRLYQDQTYKFGNAYVQQSSLPIAGGGTPATYPNPGPTFVTLAFNGENAGNAMRGQFVTPTFVQNQFASAQQMSNGRLQNSAMVQAPGLVFG